MERMLSQYHKVLYVKQLFFNKYKLLILLFAGLFLAGSYFEWFQEIENWGRHGAAKKATNESGCESVCGSEFRERSAE